MNDRDGASERPGGAAPPGINQHLPEILPIIHF